MACRFSVRQRYGNKSECARARGEKSPKFSVLENFGLCEKLQYAVYKVSSVLFWETLRFLWCLEVYVL